MLGKNTVERKNASRKTIKDFSAVPGQPGAKDHLNRPKNHHSDKENLSIHCLVVDDDSMIRDILTAMLQHLEIKVTTAIDGHDAKEKISKEHYDLVITDLQMPNMNGLSLLKWINAHKEGLKVILMSGIQDKNIIQEALRHKALDFLRKPISVKTINQTIKRYRDAITNTGIFYLEASDAGSHELNTNHISVQSSIIRD